MAVSIAQLESYVDAPAGDEYAATCLAEAEALVTGLLGRAASERVDESVRDRAVLETASTLWHKRTTKLGVIGIGDTDAQPVRAARDPLIVARSILGPYLIGIG